MTFLLISFSEHPVHTAIDFSQPECLRHLLSKGASTRATYPFDKNRTLHHAIMKVDGSITGTKNSEEVIHILLETKEAREVINDSGNGGMQPLYRSVLLSTEPVERDKKRFSQETKVEAFVRIMEAMLAAGADVNLSYNLIDPLQIALMAKADPRIVKVLLKHGANPNNCMGLKGQSTLCSAMVSDNPEVVKMLLETDVDVNMRGMDGHRPFTAGLCIKPNLHACAELLVRHPAFRYEPIEIGNAQHHLDESFFSPEERHYFFRDKSCPDKLGERLEKLELSKKPVRNKKDPVIIRAVEEGDVERLEKEIEHCTNIDAKNSAGETALYRAISKNDFEVAEILLDHGASVTVQSKEGLFPINESAKMANSLELLDALLAKGADGNAAGTDGKTPFFLAVQYGRVENVEFLGNVKDVDVNLGEATTGTAALHLMAQENNVQMMEAILKLPSANINVLNKFGATPLHYAAKSDCVEAAEFLLSRDVSAETTCDVRWNTPLHVAAACNSLKVGKLLIAKGALVNAKNADMESPLFMAAMTNSEEMLELLMANGADIDAKNVHGQTPLYVAVNFQAHNTANILVEEGADIHAREKYRSDTILHSAVSTANLCMTRQLLRRGVSLEVKDSFGYTAFLRTALTDLDWVMEELLELGADHTVTVNEHVSTFNENRRENFLDLVAILEQERILKKIVKVDKRTRMGFLAAPMTEMPGRVAAIRTAHENRLKLEFVYRN